MRFMKITQKNGEILNTLRMTFKFSFNIFFRKLWTVFFMVCYLVWYFSYSSLPVLWLTQEEMTFTKRCTRALGKQFCNTKCWELKKNIKTQKKNQMIIKHRYVIFHLLLPTFIIIFSARPFNHKIHPSRRSPSNQTELLRDKLERRFRVAGDKLNLVEGICSKQSYLSHWRLCPRARHMLQRDDTRMWSRYPELEFRFKPDMERRKLYS